jgi:hypothetical protein
MDAIWKDQFFYSSTLSSGQIPESDDAFIQELISDMDYEGSLIFTNFEERFSASVSPYSCFFFSLRDINAAPSNWPRQTLSGVT